MAAIIRECTDKCRSTHHVELCISALTKCTDDQFKLLSHLCRNTLTKPSTDGRTVLHLAASLGRTDLVQWLQEQNVDLLAKDTESNWTALHRALFYGHLTTARELISSEPACLNLVDNEGRRPLDLVVSDRRYKLCRSPNNELYSWGENVNFTLGQPSEQARLNPEIVLPDDNVTGFDDVIMCKYHTLLLTSNGHVMSCGHGWGGRLGHGNEATLLTPKLIASLKNETVVSIGAAKDHSVFLTENNVVYTCGLNDHHQLGQEGGKFLQPKMVKHKLFKDYNLKGVCAGRFHTVVWASDALFTFGLNTGQLGHHQGDTYQTTPRLVSGIQYKTSVLEKVVSSDAAILCYTKQGELILISEFRIRKIAANWTIEKIAVFGGKLDHRNELEALKEIGGTEVSVGVTNKNDQLFLWRQSDSMLRRVNFSGLPWLSLRDFQITKNCLVLVSLDGQVFTAPLPAERRKFGSKKKKDKDSILSNFKAISLSDLCRGDETCYVEMTRVRGIHRAVSIFMDSKAENFMAIQSIPNDNLTLVPEISPSEMTSHISQLYSETGSDDVIHDVILESKNLRLPAHQFILSSGCNYFHSLFGGDNNGQLINVDVGDLGNADLIVQMVKFIYTGTCELTEPGSKFKFTLQPLENTNGVKSPVVGRDGKKNKKKGKSAFAVKQENTGIPNEDIHESQSTGDCDVNPVRMLKEMAKNLGVKFLREKLDNITWSDGKISLKDKNKRSRDLVHSFNRRKMSNLFDIKLKSEDGQIFNCHKCILTARMEYFHSMLTCGWLETEFCENVTLPVIGPIFHVILQYLYTDDSPDLRTSKDVEFICNVLVAADQLLISRLKEICESVICQHLTLKNAAEILEFACVYNAQQLKLATQQFVCLNLTALLEARSLDVVSDDVMDELSEFYRSCVPSMCRRKITPYDEPPSRDALETLSEYGMDTEDNKLDNSFTRPKPKRRRSSKSDSKSRESFSEVIVEMTSPEQTSVSTNVSIVPKSPDSPIDVIKSPTIGPTWPTTPTSPTSPTSWPPTPTTPTSATWPPPRGATSPMTSSVEGQVTMTSSGDAPSLREIIEEESHQSHSSSSGRKKKLSQKERKRLMHEASKPPEPQPKVIEPTNNCPWAPPLSSPWTANPPNPAPSLRQLMEQESHSLPTTKSQSKLKTPSKGSKTNISWGLASNRTEKPKNNEASVQEAPTEPQNPWTPISPTSNTSFTELVEEEKSETITLNRTRKKALHLIQAEEQAMSELLAFYKANNAADVKITVERMTRVAATPTWAAKQ